MKRLQPLLPITGALLILLSLGLLYGPGLIPGLPVGPLDKVVAVYESGTPTAEDNAVMFGQTANAIRVAGRWRQYDQNVLPDALAADLQAAVDSHGVPCVVLYRAGRPVYSGPLPATDSALASMIQQHGGILE